MNGQTLPAVRGLARTDSKPTTDSEREFTIPQQDRRIELFAENGVVVFSANTGRGAGFFRWL